MIGDKIETKNSAKMLTWIIVAVLLAGTVGLIVLGARETPQSGQASVVNSVVSGVSANDWTKGNKDAKVTVVEYGDYQCPACRAVQDMVNQLEKNYGNRVLFIFRNFPLYTVHDNAGISAQAAEAAGLQGKFWEMHDLLYDKQAEWSLLPFGIGTQTYFDNLASHLGLDVNKFNQDINSSQVKDKIKKDVDSANAGSIDHTPTFFVNFKQIPNPNGYDEFKSILDKALASS